MSIHFKALTFLIVCVLASPAATWIAADEKTKKKTDERTVPWTTSRVKGSPEPPLPYKTTEIFGKLELDRPTNITWLPTAKKWVANHAGGMVVAFDNDPENAVLEPLLDLSKLYGQKVQTGYATKFHYDLENQPWCFLTFTTKRRLPDGHHFARLKVIDPTIPSFDLDSLKVIARWKSHGHVGSSMQFGPDGMFYLSVGDGQPPYPPDPDGTGQDLSDLRSSILRIDVDDPTEQQPYKIPDDNPFVGRKNARGEIWAYGFRNPWKIAFDPQSGDLVAADVGWEMREMIHRIKRGRNHGWSIMEGSQQVKQGQQPATPITPPLFEHTHLDSRSISGGHFWQSDRIPELKGAYIYGDWMTGKVWGLKFKGDEVIWQKELVDTPRRVICFMLDPTGEVLIVGYDGKIMQLQPNPVPASHESFPQRLSETGIFANTQKQEPATGVIEYQINANHWADGTHSRQWIGFPDSTQLGLYKKFDWKTGQSGGRFIFPAGTVAVKTVSYFKDAQDAGSQKHIETQLLHKFGDQWRAYNYLWNEEQTDAVLQEDEAIESQLVINDQSVAGGKRTQVWRHSSRSECLLCHVWSAGTVQGFWPPQLNRPNSAEGSNKDVKSEAVNQLDSLAALGIFAEEIPRPEPITSPHNEEASLESRARSYLQMNCSTCHRRLGGGTANFTFNYEIPLEKSKYLDAIPAQGTFGIVDAKVVAPGDPGKSVLLYRALKSGRGHMPQFGSNVLDREGIKLMHDWIASMQTDKPKPASSATDTATRLKADITTKEIETMLSTVEGAMSLSIACNGGNLNEKLRAKIVELGANHSHAPVRDLFEHYLPQDQRVKRLGPSIDEAALLAIEGSAEHGKKLFETALDVNCRNCHLVGSAGKAIGPDLSGIGTQQTPAELLHSILQPSDKIDPKYRARQILKLDGVVVTGIVTSETDKQLTIVDDTGKAQQIAVEDIDDMQAATKSAMPEQLLSGMTPQHAADLLAYLSAQRKIGPLQHKRAKIQRTNGKIVIDGRRDEAAWDAAQSMGDFAFTWWKQGDPQQQPTDAKLLWDDDYLYVSFVCTDRDVQATRKGRDSKVYRDDCVEVFASPDFDHPENYFNLEMNALGEQLDHYRPNGEVQKDWDPDGIQIAVSVNGTINEPSDVDTGWTLEVAIPFRHFSKVIPNGKPTAGDRWRLNLSRLEQEISVKSQWSQGDRNFARFHHPEYFGFVEFVDSTSKLP